MYTKINEAASYIQSFYNKPIDIAIVLGSGLGPLAQEIENPIIIDYQDIPHFPVSTLVGHEGKSIIKQSLQWKEDFTIMKDMIWIS